MTVPTETSTESAVLDWFERALEQPGEQRKTWLAAQDLPDALRLRVQRLLDTECSLGGFLEHSASAPEPEGFPAIGEHVGNYQLLARLDAGGMGVVYRARRADGSYDQDVAVKLIRPLHLMAAPEFRRQMLARFEQERILLARLQHPNIARILDGGRTASGLPWLAMEFVDGISLTGHCDRDALDLRARLRLFLKVCAGVQEAHRHLVVHRDLKPDNILVTRDGEPKLLDFGIARTLGEDANGDPGATQLTAMTPAYASPEHVRRQPLTTASDVYSLGVLLFQLVAGERPYRLDGLTPAEAERAICDGEPPSLRSVLQRAGDADPSRGERASQLTDDLQHVVAKAMHKDAARRYATAQSLAADIERWLQGKPVLAHPDSAGYRLRKFVGRHPLGVAAGTLALAAVLAASGIAMWQAQQARQGAADLREMNDFLLEVTQASDPFDADRELTLSEALDVAATRIDERFGSRPELAAEIRFGIAYSMLSRYRLDAAEAQLGKALAESRAAFGDDDIRSLRIGDAIAYLRQEQDRGKEAEAGFREVIARLERNRLTDDPLYGIVLGNLGNLYLVREDYRQADPWLRKSMTWFDAHPGAAEKDRVNILSNLAHAAHGLEDLPRADTLYASAQAAMAVAYPQGSPDQAILLNNRALLAEDRGDTQAALALHRQSLAMRRKVFSSEHPMTLTALTNVARVSLDVGEARQALPIAEDAGAMADRVYAEVPNGRHASTWATVADVRLANGDTTGAAAALRRADTVRDTVKDPAPSMLAYLEKVRARVCTTPAACPAR
ncbi:serine/threonine-protein kinase [Thermomonas carbonis]|uniref:Serine/threonine protein kinase n=1 Tax=Thermomonas carbonis TaxID=1463158 RepID=A0A7G9STD3_9GAMM|nr:serine/threonine-protein kinase [Thermomonas carbonis]QNN71108.1 serine/threonine protein kinase [Thermomonas carbonis]GHC12296.1 hypothetical protein GCM10010080_29910 [Thermomonas carbonis]